MPFGPQDDWLLSPLLFHVSGQGSLCGVGFAGVRMTVRDKQLLSRCAIGVLHASLVLTQCCGGCWRPGGGDALKAVLPRRRVVIPAELTDRASKRDSLLVRWRLTEFARLRCMRQKRPMVR